VSGEVGSICLVLEEGGGVDEFGYLSVLISIILGLGITQLLTGLGRLVNSRAGALVLADDSMGRVSADHPYSDVVGDVRPA
jgi:hypothetical protein